MAVEAMAIALHHSRAVGTAKVVLLGIANHVGDGGSWPAVATLAKYANVSTRAVQEAIAKLEDLGEIRRELQAGGNSLIQDHRRPNLYHFTLTCPPECDRSMNHRHGVKQSSPHEAEFTRRGEAEFTQTSPTEPRLIPTPIESRHDPYANDATDDQPSTPFLARMASMAGLTDVPEIVRAIRERTGADIDADRAIGVARWILDKAPDTVRAPQRYVVRAIAESWAEVQQYIDRGMVA